MEVVLILVFFGIIAATIAGSKGRSGFGWFILGLCFGPFALAVALLPSLKNPIIMVAAAPAVQLRACPQCGEPIQKTARKCRFCQAEVKPVKDLVCFHCGQMNLHNANFCEFCGKSPRSYF